MQFEHAWHFNAVSGQKNVTADVTPGRFATALLPYQCHLTACCLHTCLSVSMSTRHVLLNTQLQTKAGAIWHYYCIQLYRYLYTMPALYQSVCGTTHPACMHACMAHQACNLQYTT